MVTSELVKGAEMIKGRYAFFTLRSVSYYPSDKVKSRIAWALYHVDLKKDGLSASSRYLEDQSRNDTVDVGAPFTSSDAEGSFLLFLPEDKPAWGLLDVRKVIDRRPDINLSLLSPIALMPHQLHIISGGIYDHKSQFSVADQEGSLLTLHCDALSP